MLAFARLSGIVFLWISLVSISLSGRVTSLYTRCGPAGYPAYCRYRNNAIASKISAPVGYATSFDNILYALNTTSGQPRWIFSADASIQI